MNSGLMDLSVKIGVLLLLSYIIIVYTPICNEIIIKKVHVANMCLSNVFLL